jgi:phage repressor protein C with HTH and peptisase S24 domain
MSTSRVILRFSPLKNAVMHPQMERLYTAALELRRADNPSAVARLLEESPQTVHNWEGRGISAAGLLKAQKLVGCRAEWLATGQGEMVGGVEEGSAIYLVADAEYAPVRCVNLRLQAGVTGFATDEDPEEQTPIVFRRDWLTRKGYKPLKLIAVRIKGSSMEPSLFDGDTVLIDTAQSELKDGCVYAVNYEGEAVIKRMVRDAGQWWLSSDNQDASRYPRKLANGSAIIIGQIVHKQSERI